LPEFNVLPKLLGNIGSSTKRRPGRRQLVIHAETPTERKRVMGNAPTGNEPDLRRIGIEQEVSGRTEKITATKIFRKKPPTRKGAFG